MKKQRWRGTVTPVMAISIRRRTGCTKVWRKPMQMVLQGLPFPAIIRCSFRPKIRQRSHAPTRLTPWLINRLWRRFPTLTSTGTSFPTPTLPGPSWYFPMCRKIKRSGNSLMRFLLPRVSMWQIQSPHGVSTMPTLPSVQSG
ncbi:hypothetical protein D3C80_1707590 [compost metagenome]